MALVLVWLFSTRWEVVWRGVWFWPRVAILYVRFTTVMYVLAWTPGEHVRGK